MTLDELKALLRDNSLMARGDSADTGYIQVGYVIEKLDQLDTGESKAERRLADVKKLAQEEYRKSSSDSEWGNYSHGKSDMCLLITNKLNEKGE